jgi:hypothetical protein
LLLLLPAKQHLLLLLLLLVRGTAVFTAMPLLAVHAAFVDAHMVISTIGSTLMLSALSRAFSTSSLTVVYKHLPGCRNASRGTTRSQHSLRKRYVPV